MTDILDILQSVDVHDFVVSLLVLFVPTAFSLLFWYKSPLVRSPVRLSGGGILLVVSLMIYPICLSVRTGERGCENGFCNWLNGN